MLSALNPTQTVSCSDGRMSVCRALGSRALVTLDHDDSEVVHAVLRLDMIFAIDEFLSSLSEGVARSWLAASSSPVRRRHRQSRRFPEPGQTPFSRLEGVGESRRPYRLIDPYG